MMRRTVHAVLLEFLVCRQQGNERDMLRLWSCKEIEYLDEETGRRRQVAPCVRRNAKRCLKQNTVCKLMVFKANSLVRTRTNQANPIGYLHL